MPTVQPSREVSTYERPAPAWPWRLAVGTGALVLTALTALLVPLADLMSRGPQPSTLTFRTIELSPWQPPPAPPVTPPPPPPPPAPPPPPLQPRPIAPPAPAPPAPSERLRLPLRLDFNLTPTRGDVALDFDPTPFAAAALPTEIAPAPPAPPAPPPAATTAETAEPAEVKDLDRAPEVVVQTRPVYPYRARAQRLEGHVDLRFTVTADGRVVDVECLQAEPPHVFDDAAITAVRRWTFTPGQRQGQAVAARMQIRIRFTLEEP